jgi:hypothetical protein
MNEAESARPGVAARDAARAEGTPLGTHVIDAGAGEVVSDGGATSDNKAARDGGAMKAGRDVGPTVKTRAIWRERSARKLVIGAAAVVGMALAVTIGVVVWAHASVSQARRIAEVNESPATPAVPVAVQAEPPGARLTTAEPAPALAPSESETGSAVPMPAPGPVPVAARVSVSASAAVAAPVPVPARPGHHAAAHHEKTTLTVWSEPAGAEVVYNGVVIGKTPLVTKVDRNKTATIWFRKKNYTSDWRRIITKEPAKTVSIQLKGAQLRPPI